jgi:hypothetical protein
MPLPERSCAAPLGPAAEGDVGEMAVCELDRRPWCLPEEWLSSFPWLFPMVE